jgi:hypothetical protein
VIYHHITSTQWRGDGYGGIHHEAVYTFNNFGFGYDVISGCAMQDE